MKKIIIFVLISLLTLPIITQAKSNGAQPSQVMIFVSFSMPDESMKQWLTAAQKIHAPIIIRGLVNNSFKETVEKLRPLANDSLKGLQIDPEAFKRFNIKSVPAVVVTSGSTQCPAEASCIPPIYDVVYGDTTLAYALEQIVKRGLVKQVAEKALVKLRGQT